MSDTSREGAFSDYLNRRSRGENLDIERKKQLARISQIRQRPILVMAANLANENAPISINYADILPFRELAESLEGEAVDVLIETPGGRAEVAEDLVKILRKRFKSVAFIIPGWAKSAGTIMAMAGDEILMEPDSSLGPIDAQMSWNNKVFSADAFLINLERMKEEADDPDKGLSRAYVPILQQISPGEIQTAQNASRFSRTLVSEWLEKYKFRGWTHHSSGEPVTPEKRKKTAKRIAKKLCDHQNWLTHGRSIKIEDLEKIGLKIYDYSQNTDLKDAISRYYALTQIAFESNLYKLFETEHANIGKYWNVPAEAQIEPVKSIDINAPCPLCKSNIPLQMKIDKSAPDAPGRIPYPKNDLMKCPHCHQLVNLTSVRETIERDIKQKGILQ